MNDESVLNDIKKYDDFFIVEDNILWEVFDDKCSKAEVIWDKENICELLNKLYNKNEELKSEMIDKEIEIIGLEDVIENLNWKLYEKDELKVVIMNKRFITNEVGCVVDLEDSKLTNYDGDEVINLLNSLDRKIKKEENEIGHLKCKIEDFENDNCYLEDRVNTLWWKNKIKKEKIERLEKEIEFLKNKNI